MADDFLDDPKGQLNNNLETEKSLEGNRLSVSQFENLIPTFNKCTESNSELEILEYLKKKEVKEPNVERTRKNAKASIRGTQLHQLQYFHQLFSRVEQLGRGVGLDDFSKTFPNMGDRYYQTLQTIHGLVDNTEDPIEYWDAWRLNGHDFTLPEGVTTIISPEEIKEMWEESAVTKEDVDNFSQNKGKIEDEKLNPNNSLLVNETKFVTNMNLESGNLQVPTIVDELVIPREFPYKPIQLIDYKTGKQFREPGKIDRLQIFLMMTSVLTNVFFRIEDIQWGKGMWEIAHDRLQLPFIPPRKYFNDIAVGKISKEDILRESDFFRSMISFKYINPLTQESIEVSANDIGVDTNEGVSNFLVYLDELNKFNTKYKKVLIERFKKGKSLPYRRPEFGYDGFKKGNILKEQMQVGLGF